MLNTQDEGKRRSLASLTGARFRRRISASVSQRTGRFTRHLGGHTRPIGPSRAMTMWWRLMAHGTEPGHPAGILTAWPRWEHFARYMWPTMRIPGAPFGLIEIRIEPYEDKPLVLGDGTEIREGMLVGEMHCNNLALLDLVRKREVNPFSACRQDLRSLAAWVSNSEAGSEVEAFFALTMLGRGAARLGFSIRHRPVNLRNRLDRLFMTGLLLLYNVDGLQRLSRGATLNSYPQEVWMSRRKLIRLYQRPRALTDESDSDVSAE